MIPLQNFNFLIGKWTVLNRRLKERLNHCTEWETFSAKMESKSILNGLGVMDEMKTTHFGIDFIGLSIRMLDPKTQKWTIYWADTDNPQHFLKEQVTGTFRNGIGKFFGNERYKGKMVHLRFVWTQETEDTAQWEQAYLDERTQEWEVNWTMTFTRVEGGI